MVVLPGILCFRLLQVHEKERSIEDDDHCEVGGTSGKRFALAFGRLDFYDGKEDANVGDEDSQEGASEIHCGEDQELLFFVVGVGAGEGEERWVSTIEMVNDVGVTEGQLESQNGLYHRV